MLFAALNLRNYLLNWQLISYHLSAILFSPENRRARLITSRFFRGNCWNFCRSVGSRTSDSFLISYQSENDTGSPELALTSDILVYGIFRATSNRFERRGWCYVVDVVVVVSTLWYSKRARCGIKKCSCYRCRDILKWFTVAWCSGNKLWRILHLDVEVLNSLRAFPCSFLDHDFPGILQI